MTLTRVIWTTILNQEIDVNPFDRWTIDDTVGVICLVVGLWLALSGVM